MGCHMHEGDQISPDVIVDGDLPSTFDLVSRGDSHREVAGTGRR